ncbi:Ldh family oxidoreductase [Nonomuraea sp. NPDC003754]
MLTVRDLVVVVGAPGEEAVLLRGLDLDISAGQTVLVRGARGSGKSVLGAVLKGELRPRFGQISGQVLVVDDADRLPVDHLAALVRERKASGKTTVLLATDAVQGERVMPDRVFTLAKGTLIPESSAPDPGPDLRLPAGKVRDLTVAALRGVGATEKTAGIVADVLVEADVRGHPSHGVGLLPTYLERVSAGGIDPTARPVLSARGATARVDARAGFGQVAAARAAEWCALTAVRTGVSAVAVHHNNHVGMMAAYRWPFQRHRTVGLLYNVSGPSLAAPGAVRPTLGSNAVCLVTPTRRDEPFVVDFATGVVAIGKIRDAGHRGAPVPPGWLLDGEGRTTTDPADLEQGGSVPLFGGYKGLCVTVIAEVLAGMLGGHTISPLVGKQRKRPGRPMNCSQLFIGLSPAAFGLDEIDTLIEALRVAVTAGYAGGAPEPHFPDQLEAAHTSHSRAEGLRVPRAVADALGWR